VTQFVCPVPRPDAPSALGGWTVESGRPPELRGLPLARRWQISSSVRPGGLKGRQVAVLPACNGTFPCLACKRQGNDYAASNREQLRSHMRQKHPESRNVFCMKQFTGHMRDAEDRKQYGQCVCGSASCVYTGAQSAGDVWVQHPEVTTWQATVRRPNTRLHRKTRPPKRKARS
jgi:hypothetical protein